MPRTRKPKPRRKILPLQKRSGESALKAENAKLQNRIFKLEVKLLSALNRIAAFERDRKKRECHAGPSSIIFGLDESKTS